MRSIAAVLILTGITVPAAQAQVVDGVPTGPRIVDGVPVAPKHAEVTFPADSVHIVRMARPLLKCPMPVSHGIVRDSAALLRRGDHGAPPRKPAVMPVQRPNCVNPLFAKR